MYYLAYGMNTNLDQMSWRCPQAKSLGRVELPGYKLAFKGCCDIVEDKNSIMDCALWDITEQCEAALDILEGYPNFYGKKEVRVKYNGRRIRAMIYYMKSVDTLDWPSKSYLDMVAAGYLDHDMDLDQIEQALDEVENVYYAQS